MLTYPEIDPVIFSVFGLKIRWYGMMYVVGFVVGWWLARRRSKEPWAQIRPEQVDDLVFYVMLGVILGGRLGYTFFYGWAEIARDPLYIFKIWEGGMSFHGGLAGVLIAMWLYGRKLGKTMWAMTDFIAPLVPLGLGFGRIGNFINGELWGGPTENVPWAMQVSCVDRYDLCVRKLGLAPDTAMTPPLHPSMLYEAVLEGFVLFAILWWFSSKQRPYMSVSGLFLLLYGLFRFWIEFYRMPDTHLPNNGYLLFDWVTMGQILTLPMILVGAALIYLAYRPKSATEAKA
jgi:phosphatidylglycerol:prolipoprotein diacylglycerol transferase